MSENQEKPKRMTMMDKRLLNLSGELAQIAAAAQREAALRELPQQGARVVATLLEATAPISARPSA